MAIGDRRFAAQLQTKDGAIFDFDDPGCLVIFESQVHPRIHAEYFRSAVSDAWIDGEDVAFVPVPETPMGFDLGAVRAGTAGSVARAEAAARILAREGRREEH
jgi:hypothetical protein